MKNLIGALIVLLSSISLYAGHEGGPVVISYKSVPGQPLQYEITVRAFYTTSGPAVPPPSSVNVGMTSSCFPNNTAFILPRVGSGSPTPLGGSAYCGNGANYFNGLVEYKNTITFSGHCADITLWMSAGLGRFDFVDNLHSNFDVPYFYTKLNTLLGPNNSPQIPDLDLVQTACLNTPLSLFGYTDIDGDSLYFEKATAQKKSGASITNFSYVTGYSKNRPFGTAIPYTINPATGTVQSQVNSVGNYALATKYKEYRLDTATSVMVLVGEGVINYVVTGSSSCSANNSISIQYESVPNSDSIDCGSNKIRFIGSRQLSRGSLSPSGSDIEVFSTQQGSLSINSATLIQDSIVEVTLAQAAPLGDTLSLVAKVGTDGNVIISRCGTELTAYDDTLYFYTPGGVQPHASGILSRQFLTTDYNSTSSIADSIWWDFGDGTGTGQNIGAHTYSTPGTYQVTLTAFGACSSTEDTSYTIQVCDSISAAFTYSQSGDTIFFKASTPDSSAVYSWDFGDGNVGLGDSTYHVYAPGSGYIAHLMAINGCGDTVTYSDSVLTCAEPVPDWTYTVVSTTTAGMTVDFDGSASVNVVSFEWDFGDGNTNNTSLTPRHIYQTPGLHYYVSLSITNSCNQQRTKGFKMNEIGVGEHRATPSFELFPNPVKDELKIYWEDSDVYPVKVELCKMTGQVIETLMFEQFVHTITIPLRNRVAGQYILLLTDNDGGKVSQLIIKK